MINIFACTCSDRSGVGEIDKLDRFEQVFDTYYIPEASEKTVTDDISMVRPQKMYIFGVLKAFISLQKKPIGLMEKRRAYFFRVITLSFL